MQDMLNKLSNLANTGSENPTPIMRVRQAAEAKFGKVIEVIQTDSNEFFVACRREAHPFPDRPYMTISASVKHPHHPGGCNGDCRDDMIVDFYWGHYDLATVAFYQQIADKAAVAA